MERQLQKGDLNLLDSMMSSEIIEKVVQASWLGPSGSGLLD